MVGTDAAQVERLVGVVIAARDAFIRASHAAESSYLQSLFRERAEDQARIATHLKQQR